MTSPNYSGPILAGTTVTSTTAAAIVSSSTPCRAVVLKNDDASIVIAIGDAASQSINLAAGQSISLRIDNLNKIYADAASGTPTLDWIAEL